MSINYLYVGNPNTIKASDFKDYKNEAVANPTVSARILDSTGAEILASTAFTQDGDDFVLHLAADLAIVDGKFYDVVFLVQLSGNTIIQSTRSYQAKTRVC